MVMVIEKMREDRKDYNLKLIQADGFFKEFGELDDKAYSAGAIDKKHKELMGLAISVVSRCNECICYHIEGCLNAGASIGEIMEAIKIGVIGGGSITYPNARFAMKVLEEFTSEE
jgi:AhpD family alkylhydroperoxidase